MVECCKNNDFSLPDVIIIGLNEKTDIFADAIMKTTNLVLLILVTFSLSCKNHDSQSGKTVFRYNEAANITTLDPAFARDQTIIWATNQIYNGLVQLNDCMEIRPCIAGSWDISTSGLEYTFHLRHDVFFHDNPAFTRGKGRRVVAGDVVFSYNRIRFTERKKHGNMVPGILHREFFD